jgi:hypothetical protein
MSSLTRACGLVLIDLACYRRAVSDENSKASSGARLACRLVSGSEVLFENNERSGKLWCKLSRGASVLII